MRSRNAKKRLAGQIPQSLALGLACCSSLLALSLCVVAQILVPSHAASPERPVLDTLS